MSFAPTTLEKRVQWQRIFNFDFSKMDEFTKLGQSIASVTVTVTVGDGALVVGTPSISGSQVQVEISGGTAGLTYSLECAIVTSPGSYDLAQTGLLSVFA